MIIIGTPQRLSRTNVWDRSSRWGAADSISQTYLNNALELLLFHLRSSSRPEILRFEHLGRVKQLVL